MKQLYTILKWLLIGCIGVFIGSSLFLYYDYTTHTGLYFMQSALWYTPIIVRGGFTSVVVVIMLMVMWILKKKMK